MRVEPLRLEIDLRPDCMSIGDSWAFVEQFDRDPIAQGTIIAQQADRAVQLGDNHIDVTIAIEVVEQGASITMWLRQRTRHLHSHETVAHSFHEQRRLCVVGIHRRQCRLRVDVAIEDQEILVAIVVEIKEPTRPPEIRAAHETETVLAGPCHHTFHFQC